ncbi:MAG: diguanylate cyclase domain-containing protein, partial [Chloroflexota bacterium]
MKILLAERPCPDRDLLQRLLKQRGHVVHTVGDREAAWMGCRGESFPLMLIGNALPGVEGLDFCRRVRALPEGGQCWLLVMANLDEHADPAAGIDAGADDYLLLPTTEELARARIVIAERRVIRLPRSRHGTTSPRDRTAVKVLRASEELFRAAFHNAAVGMALLATGGVPVRANNRLCQMLGRSEAELLRHSFPQLLHPDDRRHVLQYMHRAADEPNGQGLECRYLRRDGEAIWCQVASSPIAGADGHVGHHLLLLIDITARKQAEDYLTQLAHYDLLTGIPNRALFRVRVSEAIGHARRLQHQLAVLFVDLDGFKAVNDTLGHATGDMVLQLVAERVTQCVRADDMVARLAGDEFTVVLPRIRGTDAAERVARTIIQALSEPFLLGDRMIHVTSSIGISIFPDAGQEVEALLGAADAAMYVAKGRGKNGFAFYQEEARA